jgi:hypothetical protein
MNLKMKKLPQDWRRKILFGQRTGPQPTDMSVNHLPAPYKRYRRRIAFVIVLVTGIGWLWNLLDSGYCISQMRYLSDRELIESALRREAAEEQMLIDGSEKSIRNFLQKHPKCCGVNRHPPNRNVFGVMTGFNISEVELNYERRGTPEQIKSWGRYHKNYVSVDACGPVLKTAYGTGTETLENAWPY